MTWTVYLLTSGRRTYIGSTTDPLRRLRQHNGEIQGGARSTRGKQWSLVLYVTGFPDRSSACRWERIAKCRARGQKAREEALWNIAAGICPPGKNMEYIPPPELTLRLVYEYEYEGNIL